MIKIQDWIKMKPNWLYFLNFYQQNKSKIYSPFFKKTHVKWKSTKAWRLWNILVWEVNCQIFFSIILICNAALSQFHWNSRYFFLSSFSADDWRRKYSYWFYFFLKTTLDLVNCWSRRICEVWQNFDWGELQPHKRCRHFVK